MTFPTIPEMSLEINRPLGYEMSVSVIIPAFKVDETILDSIDSVFNQTGVEVEVIVVDNGENENLLSFLGDKVHRVTILKQPIRGAGPARNLGVAAAKYELIAFLDSGDVWTSSKLSSQLEFPIEGLEIRGCYASFCAKSGKKFGTSVRTESDEEATLMARRGSGVPAITSSWCMKKSTFLAAGGFDPSFKSAQDLEFLNRFVRMGGKITITRIELVHYNLAASSLTMTNYKRQYLSAEYIRLRAYDPSPSLSSLENFLEISGNFPTKLWFQVNAGRYFRMGLLRYGEKKYLSSFMIFLVSVMLNPRNFFSKVLKQSYFFKKSSQKP